MDKFKGVNDGDKVRVEYEGKVVEHDALGIRILMEDGFHTRVNNPAAITVLRRALPPEPPVGTIVRDGVGVPWVRDRRGTWYSHTGGNYSWSALFVYNAPVTVIYTPEVGA